MGIFTSRGRHVQCRFFARKKGSARAKCAEEQGQETKQQATRAKRRTRNKMQRETKSREQRRRTASPKGPVRQCARGGLAINPFFPHLRIGICARRSCCLLLAALACLPPFRARPHALNAPATGRACQLPVCASRTPWQLGWQKGTARVSDLYRRRGLGVLPDCLASAT